MKSNTSVPVRLRGGAPVSIDSATGHRLRIMAYGAPAVPLAVMIIPTAALLPIYYTNHFGLSLASVGMVLLLARLFDVVTDPIVGILSDRTRSRWGRRRPWMLAGAPVLICGLFLLFVPPLAPTPGYLLFANLVTFLGWTMIQIPFWAWGAEIAPEYHSRSAVSGIRESLMIAGIALAAIIPLLTTGPDQGIGRATMLGMAVLVALILPPALLLSVKSFGEEPWEAVDSSWGALMQIVTRSRPFQTLMAAFALIELGKGAAVAVTAYLLANYFGMPQLIGLVMLLPYLCLIASVPVWLKISRKLGKHRTTSLSLALATFVIASVIPWLGPEDGYLFVLVECLIGLAAGGFAILPTAMLADAADYFALKNKGVASTGGHFASWSLARKLVQAISLGIALPLMAALGFEPSVDPSRNAEVTKWMFVGITVPLYLLGAAAIWRFPLTPRRHAIIRARVAQLKERALPRHGY